MGSTKTPRSRHRDRFPTVALLILNFLVSLLAALFIAPRISCASIPLIGGYCPLVADPPIRSPPTSPPHTSLSLENLNLASLSEGAVPLSLMSYVGKKGFDVWSSSFLWSILRSHYTDVHRWLDEDPSDCWEFAGSSAQIAIRLGHCAVLTHFVLDNAIGPGFSQSPRDAIVWGMVDGELHTHQASRLQAVREKLFARVASFGLLPPVYKNYTFIPIASSSDSNGVVGPQRFKVFKVFPEVRSVRIDFGIIVVQVDGNWGAGSTRMCHLGVYGTRL